MQKLTKYLKFIYLDHKIVANHQSRYQRMTTTTEITNRKKSQDIKGSMGVMDARIRKKVST